MTLCDWPWNKTLFPLLFYPDQKLLDKDFWKKSEDSDPGGLMLFIPDIRSTPDFRHKPSVRDSVIS